MFELENIHYLEIILFVLLCSLFFLFILKKEKEGFVEEKQDIVIHTENDIFDDFYSKIYDKLIVNNDKLDFEINHIFDTNETSKPTLKKYNVLDIGCGSGQLINKLTNLTITCVGLDKSTSMVANAKKKFKKSNFKVGDATNSLEFAEQTFSHVLCLDYTIYYFKEKRQFLENCFYWLKPNGLLYLHVVNIKKFNSDPTAKHYKSNSSSNPIQFNYRSTFSRDESINFHSSTLEEPNVTFKEIFKFTDSKKVRINQHKLYMSSQNSIINMAIQVGFMLITYVEINVDTYEYHYLYSLQKPR